MSGMVIKRRPEKRLSKLIWLPGGRTVEAIEADIVARLEALQGVCAGAMRDKVQEIVRLRAQMEEILARHTGQSVERIHADTDRDHFMDPEEARAYGLIDTVCRAFLPDLLRLVLSSRGASTVAPAMSSMLIYLLMAIVLVVRQAGLFPVSSK